MRIDIWKGYLLLLQELEKSEPGAAGGPYTFAETEVFEWRKLSEQIAASLKKRGKGDGTVKTATKDELDQFLFGEEAAYATFGGNSLASADRLRALGWQTGSGRLSLLDSIEKEEVDDMLKRLGMERRRVVA